MRDAKNWWLSEQDSKRGYEWGDIADLKSVFRISEEKNLEGGLDLVIRGYEILFFRGMARGKHCYFDV